MGCPELPLSYYFSLNRTAHFEKSLFGFFNHCQEDPIGNRTTSSSTETGTAVTRSYTSNLLNQYTAIDNPTAAPSYDDDGNMLDDGIWAFTWNGENRIITATQGTTTVEYKYDYFGRRVERKVTEDETVTSQTCYVYEPNSFNKIEELDVLDSNAIVKKYVWGLDIAGSLIKTGSVGALLAQIDGTGSAYAVCDVNGNVSEYLDGDGDIQGHFEYSPFGKATVENGVRSDDFTFRFSTKYEDALTGDLDYGYRDYDSNLGRWRSREPLTDRSFSLMSFINLPDKLKKEALINVYEFSIYRFADNNVINSMDYLGLQTPNPGTVITTGTILAQAAQGTQSVKNLNMCSLQADAHKDGTSWIGGTYRVFVIGHFLLGVAVTTVEYPVLCTKDKCGNVSASFLNADYQERRVQK